jgi:iron complex outermembrane receptor protein
LDKLKQIEVLRGPASSLYGGVALTAVVNLITKQGIDVDGIKIRAGIGNY